MVGFINVTGRPAGYQYTGADVTNLPANLINKSTQELSDLGYQAADSILGTNTNVPNPTTTTGLGTANMTLSEAQKTAGDTFNGLASPMSLSDIRAAEAAQKAAVRTGAEAQFNPQIAAEQQAGKTTLSSAVGATGQRQGFNLSTAESAYLAGVQSDINGRIKAVEDQKAAAISSGDLAAITRADDNISKLTDMNNNIAIAKANYALQLLSGNREQQTLELNKEGQAFDQENAKKQLSLSIAQSLGYFDDGTPTFQAKQAQIENAYNQANLSGVMSDGSQTLAAKTAALDYELRKQGIEIDRAQLAETIRNNKANSSASTDKSPSGLTTAAVNRLDALKDTGGFNDLNYQAELLDIAVSMGYNGTNPDVLNKSREYLNDALNAKRPAASMDVNKISNEALKNITTSAANGTLKIKAPESSTANSTSMFFGLK